MSAVLADFVVVLHFAFLLFVGLGGLFALRWPWLAWVHVPAALWGAAISFAGWICPLTYVEQALRSRAGEASYETSFIAHYLLPIIYPSGLTREVQFVIGALVIFVNVVIYYFVIRRVREGRAPAA